MPYFKFVLYTKDHDPIESFVNEYDTNQEAIASLPQELHTSTETIDRVCMFVSNENREQGSYVDGYDRRLEAETKQKEAEAGSFIDRSFTTEKKKLLQEGQKIAFFAIPNREIYCREHDAVYGYGETHKKVFFQYITLRKPMEAKVFEDVVDNMLIITIIYNGRFGKQNTEEIRRFVEHGFILDGIY